MHRVTLDDFETERASKIWFLGFAAMIVGGLLRRLNPWHHHPFNRPRAWLARLLVPSALLVIGQQYRRRWILHLVRQAVDEEETLNVWAQRLIPSPKGLRK